MSLLLYRNRHFLNNPASITIHYNLFIFIYNCIGSSYRFILKNTIPKHFIFTEIAPSKTDIGEEIDTNEF